jgi:hypothetical protein
MVNQRTLKARDLMIMTPARVFFDLSNHIDRPSLSSLARARTVFAKITPGTGWGPKSRRGGVLASDISSPTGRGTIQYQEGRRSISPRGCSVPFICIAMSTKSFPRGGSIKGQYPALPTALSCDVDGLHSKYLIQLSVRGSVLATVFSVCSKDTPVPQTVVPETGQDTLSYSVRI